MIVCRYCWYLALAGGCQESYYICRKRHDSKNKSKVIKDPDNEFCAQFKGESKKDE